MRLKDEKFYKTVRDFLDIYLIRHRGYSLNTQKSYREAINLLLLYFKAERGLEYSNVGFEDITYSNITGFLEWLSKSRGCSPATVNLRLMAIRSFTKYAGILDSGKIYMQVEVGNISVRKTPGKVVEFLTAPALETLFVPGASHAALPAVHIGQPPALYPVRGAGHGHLPALGLCQQLFHGAAPVQCRDHRH